MWGKKSWIDFNKTDRVKLCFLSKLYLDYVYHTLTIYSFDVIHADSQIWLVSEAFNHIR